MKKKQNVSRARMLSVPSGYSEKRFWQQALKSHLIYSLAGLMLGAACIVGGIILAIMGATGSTSWKITLLGFNSQLVDAAPGIILFVAGLFFVFVTRFVVKVRK